ncbi:MULTISPECIES: metal-sulfur cluster assembly factor [Microvirga]|uniref:metal-sulfur cluster assembly factor n=1 Tax=Microvirga TaxID=186650 RepID=UPI00191CE6A0|nr:MULTISPECIES: metal-sulfur cluster assembly factor [Microvirga]MBM6582820.1 metal-sulfur cluster assembly factor [Microvirga arvi]
MSDNSKRQHALDPDVLDCLTDVLDPEIGLSVVDLGLVYQTRRTPEAVEVALTLTTRACPLGEMIMEEARERLAHRFQDAPRIDVRLVWDPVWTPDFITARGQELLGRAPRTIA